MDGIGYEGVNPVEISLHALRPSTSQSGAVGEPGKASNTAGSNTQDEGQNGAGRAGLNAPENPSSFLIHTNKSGGRSGTLDTVGGCDTLDTTSVIETVNGVQVTENEGLEALPARLDRYSKRVERSIEVGRWITGQPRWKNWHPTGRRVAGCGAWLVFRDYYRRDLVKLVDGSFCCNSFLCPFCASLRGSKHLGKAMMRVKAAMNADDTLVPYLWTVTIRDEVRLKDMYKRLRAFLSKLLQMRRDGLKGYRATIWSEFAGGVQSVEVKRGSGSGLWHVHAHAVVLGRPGLDASEFKRAWSDLVGYWAQSDLRPLKSTDKLLADRDSVEAHADLASDLQEVFKYAVKFSDMSVEDAFTAFRELFGQRLVRSFGCLYGLVFNDEDLIGAEEFLEAEPYREMFFKLLSGMSGRSYSLLRVDLVEQSSQGVVCVGSAGARAEDLPALKV